MAIELVNNSFYDFDKMTNLIRGTSEMAQMMINSVRVKVDLEEKEQEIQTLAGYKQPEEYAFDKVMTNFNPNEMWSWNLQSRMVINENREIGHKKYAKSVELRFYFISEKDRADFMAHLTKEKLVQGLVEKGSILLPFSTRNLNNIPN